RIPNESSPLRPPRVGHVNTELARDQLRDPVLEALLGFVREWEVVRIGAYSELRFRLAVGTREPDQDGKRGDERCGNRAAIHAIAHRLLAARSGPRLLRLPDQPAPRHRPARRPGPPGPDAPGLHRPATLARRRPPALPETGRPVPAPETRHPAVPGPAVRPPAYRVRAARPRTRSRPGRSRPAGPASRRRSRARRTARPYRARRRRPRPT